MGTFLTMVKFILGMGPSDPSANLTPQEAHQRLNGNSRLNWWMCGHRMKTGRAASPVPGSFPCKNWGTAWEKWTRTNPSLFTAEAETAAAWL